MKPLLILALVALTACAEHGESFSLARSALVCTASGQETYRATTTQWIFTDGSWWNRYDDQQYRPSLLESCRTELAR